MPRSENRRRKSTDRISTGWRAGGYVSLNGKLFMSDAVRRICDATATSRADGCRTTCSCASISREKSSRSNRNEDVKAIEEISRMLMQARLQISNSVRLKIDPVPLEIAASMPFWCCQVRALISRPARF